MSLPELTQGDLEEALKELLAERREHYLFAVYGTSAVDSVATFSNGTFAVYNVGSELALRRQLLTLDEQARAVFAVPWRSDLPLDVAGRFALGGRVRVVGIEARLKRALGVRAVEASLLTHHPLVEHVLASNQAESLRIGDLELSERRLWEVWLERAWGVETEGGLALDAWLACAAASGRGAAFEEALSKTPGLRDAFETFLRASLGDAGPAVLRAWLAGRGERALELAVLCEALVPLPRVDMWWKPRVRADLQIEDEATAERVARQLGEVVNTALAIWSKQTTADRKPSLHALYQRAEALVDLADVRSALIESDRLPSGFRLRLDALGVALERAAVAPGAEAMKSVLAARKRLQAHASYLDASSEAHVRRADMATRLLAWLASDRAALEPATHEVADADVARLGRWYVEEGGFVDWARRLARGGAQTAFDRGVQAVVGAADTLREELDLRFARALVPWHASNRPAHLVIPIDQVGKRIIATFLDGHPQRKLLLLLLDGMAWAQAAEILDSLGEHSDGWGPAAFHAQGRALKLGEARTPVVLAGFPTVTEVSRAAFFAGSAMRSGKSVQTEDDPVRFRDHPALKKYFSDGEYPRLFLRGEGHLAHGVASQHALTAIADPNQRVVGVVINAIDASLKGDSQQWHPWRAENVRSLPEFLAAAKRAGRSVLLASDHGHVPADRFRSTARFDGGGARWRPLASASAPIEAHEIKLSGEGVVVPKGSTAVALLADDRHRHGGGAHAGEHGGATLAEAIAPCVVLHWDDPLSAAEDPPRYAQGQVKPEWWHFEVTSASDAGAVEPLARPEPKSKPKRAKPENENQLALLPELAKPAPEPIAAKPASVRPSDPLLAALQDLPDVKALPASERKLVLDAIAYVLERDGIAQMSALASHLAMPDHRVRGLVSRHLQRLLNMDGFLVVSYDATQVRLSREILQQQLGSGS